MDLSTFVSSAGTALGLALIGLWAFAAGKIHSDPEFRRVCAERDEYKAALAAERQAMNETATAGSVTNQLIGALARVASERRPLDLAGKDVGT